MYQLAQPRHEGRLRTRWRNRQGWRRTDLAARLRLDAIRAECGPDWLGMLYAEQLSWEITRAEADLAALAPASVAPRRGEQPDRHSDAEAG